MRKLIAVVMALALMLTSAAFAQTLRVGME